jgi:3-deoxy-D-manno-octulosonic-acid transferase
MYSLYRLLQILGFPFMVLYFAMRGLRDRSYLRHFGERLGWLPEEFRHSAGGAVWLHAVSVGEALSSVELVRSLRAEFPGTPLFVSTTTVAGRAAAADKLAGLTDGIFYAPIDYCFAVRRVLRALRPAVLVVLETELWPNLFREAARAGSRVLVANGRISDRAWPRYSALQRFFRPMLAIPEAVLVQNEVSRRRYVELGAPPERVRTAGNLKYDFDPRRAKAPDAVVQFVEHAAPAEIWIAASTMPPAETQDVDEDEAVIAAFRQLAPRHPGLLLILVPRKPERFETAAELLAREGLRFARRSRLGSGGAPPALPAVLLLDSIGELSGIFGLADVVFMGGTLARRGGHNILEPAFFGRPVIAGPHMENFPEIAQKFAAAGAMVSIPGSEGLEPAVDRLLVDMGQRADLGRRAREAAEAEQGAAARVVEEIRRQLDLAVPRPRPAVPYRLVLWPLSRLWLLGGRLKRAAGLARRRRLATPVVSVGGLALGGTGKSPIVLWLAQRLKERGRRPAVLTRGYRRAAGEQYTVLAPGERAAVGRTGDEAQAYLRAGVGPVGIGADRYGAGLLVEERFQPGVFLLDDGFQHWRLGRALDIVAIDALEPFGRGPFPLGRLRECPAALGRAGLIVLTRTTPGRTYAGLEAEIRRYNERAPVFRSRAAPKSWVNAATGEVLSPEDLTGGTAAFCGLGNPGSFWQSLAALGYRPVFRSAFPDHHPYRLEELRALASRAREAGAAALLTTQKDVANLPEDWQGAIGGLPLWGLEIEVEIEGAERFLAAVEDALSQP